MPRSKKTDSEICNFCATDTIDELNLGEFMHLQNINVHYFCMLLSSGLKQNGNDNQGILGFLLKDIKAELQRGRKLKCYYCKRTGATIGCAYNKCARKFHLPCALQEQSLHQFYGAFPSYCKSHKPLQELTQEDHESFQRGKNNVCAICLFAMEKLCMHSIIRAPCCKNAFLHRVCLQQQALNAGYFFRCPLCNNEDTFQQEMLQFGVFIPQRDATWEREVNAYQDLLFRHDTCDADKCACPGGRNFNNSGSRWEIVLCNSCGSNGCHVKCGNLKWLKRKWECDDCLNVQKSEPRVNGATKKRKKKIMGATCILLKKSKLDAHTSDSDSDSDTPSDTDTASEVDVVGGVDNSSSSGSSNSLGPPAASRTAPLEVIQVPDSDSSDSGDDYMLRSLLANGRKVIPDEKKSPESKSVRIFQHLPHESAAPKDISYVNLISSDDDDDESEVRSEVDPGSFYQYDSADTSSGSDGAAKKADDGFSWLKSMGVNDEPDTEIWVPETDRRYEFYSRTGASGVKIVVLTTELSSSDVD